MQAKIRLGTRGSKLALAQSNQIADQLRSLGHVVDVTILKTTGDVVSGPLTEAGGEGVFTKRLQTALAQNEIDLAVHSLKDLPTDDFPGLKIGAVPIREDHRDALLMSNPIDPIKSIDKLPANAIVGTGSVRRKAQLLHLRPDLDVRDIRGNVDTRIAKLDAGEFHAIVLACAGLNRIGLANRISCIFEVQQMAPAVGQGALGLEIRNDDETTRSALASLNDDAAFASVMAERSMLNQLRAGCMAPVGAITRCTESMLELTGIVLSKDGSRRVEATAAGSPQNAPQIGEKVASLLIADGAGEMISRQA